MENYQILYRFSKKTGIPISELNVHLVKFLNGRKGGAKENLKDIYTQLQRFHVLSDAHKRAGMTYQKLIRVLGVLERGEEPEEVFNWLKNI